MLEFFTRMLSKIIQRQEVKATETLPVDLRKQPVYVLKGVQKFIEHRIQLLEVKGLEEFLLSKGRNQLSHNRVGKEQYSNIMDISRNVLNLVLSG